MAAYAEDAGYYRVVPTRNAVSFTSSATDSAVGCDEKCVSLPRGYFTDAGGFVVADGVVPGDAAGAGALAFRSARTAAVRSFSPLVYMTTGVLLMVSAALSTTIV